MNKADEKYLEEVLERHVKAALRRCIPPFIDRYEARKLEARTVRESSNENLKKALIYHASHPAHRVRLWHEFKRPLGGDKDKGLTDKVKDQILSAFTRKNKL